LLALVRHPRSQGSVDQLVRFVSIMRVHDEISAVEASSRSLSFYPLGLDRSKSVAPVALKRRNLGKFQKQRRAEQLSVHYLR
jgi:hypothetical protein